LDEGVTQSYRNRMLASVADSLAPRCLHDRRPLSRTV
jgi:hypothetical protein